MTNLENLKKLAENLGADASGAMTNLGALNVISAALGGSGDAGTNAEAIEDIAQAAPGMMKQDVVWAADTLTLSDMTALTEVVIPEGVTEIGGFGGCSGLKTIEIPDSVKKIASGGFGGCSALTEFSAAGVTETISLFGGCSSLKTVSLPNVVTMNGDFGGCTALESVYLPKAETFNLTVFGSCIVLEKIELPSAKYFADQCFGGCSVLTALILPGENVVETGGDPLSGTAIAKGTGYIYVPAALVDTYKAAANWSTYASQIRAIEDYPDICG